MVISPAKSQAFHSIKPSPPRLKSQQGQYACDQHEFQSRSKHSGVSACNAAGKEERQKNVPSGGTQEQGHWGGRNP